MLLTHAFNPGVVPRGRLPQTPMLLMQLGADDATAG